jgi:hypothetical protein
MIFDKADSVKFYEVLDGLGAPQWGLELGEVLEVAQPIPREVQDLERRGLLRVLPDPGATLLPWLRLVCRVRPVSAQTFVTRPEPPEPVYLDEPAVLTRMGWTAEQLREAQVRLHFPRHEKTRERFVENHGMEITAKLFALSHIEKWERELPRDLFVGAGR